MGDGLGQAELLDSRRLPPAIDGSVLGATEVIPDRPLGDAQDSRGLALRLVSLVQNIDRHDLLPCELCQGDASERPGMSRTSLKALDWPVDGCPVRRSYWTPVRLVTIRVR
jgi:hypothetical protein